jgi:hypothetical protein
MQLPPKKVKQMQKQIVNGQECKVEVEVEVVEKAFPLFGRAEMPFHIRSFNTCLPVIFLASFLIGFCLPYQSSYIPRNET